MRLLLLILIGAFTINAQTSDTAILGKVTDSAGAVLPKASITIIERSTGVARTAATRSEGNYEIRYLVPGEYSVEVRADGFRTERRTGIVIQIGQQARIDFGLQVGTLQQTLEVTESAPLLQTENATLGSVVGGERITDLPLNGRQFDDLAVLTPGVTVVDPNFLTSRGTSGSEIVANGQRPVWGQVNVDGVTMVNNRRSYVNIFPSIDAIQEFKVQTGNFSAEYGGNAGANVNIQIKSGTNQIHGDAFEFLRNNDLDARNYFLPAPHPKNILKQNQFGATVGGPIVHDKTFFFTSYEGLRSIYESPGTTVVLTPAQRAGDFSASSKPVTDPFTGTPFPNNIIPTSRLDHVSANIANQYMPLPNTPGAANYTGTSTGNITTHQGIVRIDQYFSPKDQLFGHYIAVHRSFPEGDINPNFTFRGDYPMSNFQAQYIHIFSPTVLNELRGGFDREDVSLVSVRTGTNFTIQSLGINGLNVGGPNGRPLRPDEQGFPIINISGYIAMGDDKSSSNIDNSQTYQVIDNLTWVRGVHTFKFGADVRKVVDDATTNNWPFGNMSFTSNIANDPAAAYMLGYPRTTLTPEGVPFTKARQWRSGFYTQDDWKITPRLTLNLGLRYDFFTGPLDVNNISRTLQFQANGPPVLYPAPGQALNPIWNPGRKDFGPRFGFAYSAPKGIVIRGGYGIFYYGGQTDNVDILQLNPPAAGSLTITNPAINPIATIENPVPAALYPANPYFNAVTLPSDRKHPDTYAQDWNLQVSRQFGPDNVVEVGYVGSRGVHIDSSLDNYNQPLPGPGDIQSRRPYGGFARIRLQYFYGNSIYHSLQARYEHRFSKGLSVTAAYTFSHLIDDTANGLNEGGCVCQDPNNLKSNIGNSVMDQRHLLVVGYVWELPFAKNLHGITGGFIGGWSFNGLVTLASGNPFDVQQNSDAQNNDGIWERPLLVPGQRLSVPNQGPAGWFNTAAFTPSVFVFGNSPRNPLVGPGTHAANLSLFKTFHMPFSDHHTLQIRVEAFNALNTPQFSNPSASLGSTTFGKITSTRLNNRELQFALKYRF